MTTKGNYLGFIQLNRSPELQSLIKVRHTAFVLLTMIALRARRTNDEYFDDLQIGEAYLGDYESYGVTESVYRADKKFLEKYKLVTFKPTTKGTIARLVSTDYFNINAEESTNTPSPYQHSNPDHTTTNNKEKNDNKKIAFNAKKNPIMEDEAFTKLLEVYHRGDDIGVRAKMSLAPVLASRYPTWKFQKEWDEANKFLTAH